MHNDLLLSRLARSMSFANFKGQTFSHLKLKFSLRETIPASETPSISAEYLLS